MITEDYVSFETAALLKEKGMDVSCFNHYVQKNNNDGTSEAVTVCTLQMAMKWLREVYNVNIEIPYNRFEKNYKYLIIYKPEVLDDIKSPGVFHYYKEAADAAIKYSGKHLI